MKERSSMIGWVRGEIVGPTVFLEKPAVVDFKQVPAKVKAQGSAQVPAQVPAQNSNEFSHESQRPSGPIDGSPTPTDNKCSVTALQPAWSGSACATIFKSLSNFKTEHP